MASTDMSVEPKETECPVCHEDFTKPKILPCAHVICRDCIVTWLRRPDTEALCPICRCVISDPQPGVGNGAAACRTITPESLEGMADALPTDLAMEALVESVHMLDKDHVCRVCDGMEAVSMCLNCGDMLCGSCSVAHSKLSATRHHILETLCALTAESLAAIRPTPCVSHADEASRLYCPTHRTSICLLCATSEHRTCPEVTKQETQAEKARAVLADLAAKLNTGERELERAMEELDLCLSQADENEQTSLAQIEATFLALRASLDECCRQLRELAKRTKSDVKTGVNEGKAIFRGRRGKLRSHKRLVERSQRNTPPACLDTVASLLQTRVRGLDFSIDLPEHIRNIAMSSVTIDQDVLSRIEQELDRLGSLKVKLPPRPPKPKPLQILRFHRNHGSNIVLSNDGQTAEKRQEVENGNAVLVVCERMEENLLYEVRLDERGKRNGYVLWTGVTVPPPDTLKLPYSAGMWKEAVVVSHEYVTEPDGNKNASKVGKCLRNVAVGSRVGVLVDSARCLHLYFDGQDQGVVASFIPQECYAFFDIFGPYKKVTALPVTRIS